jgi:hypothetical protein
MPSNPEDLTAVGGLFWTGEKGGLWWGIRHILARLALGRPPPDQAMFEALMREAADEIDDWTARRL